ncbi:YadA-like family protein [Gallibacterium anatis]|uniref:YadA-like family protein n=1 Tax=Gallibacterium anatis TaxID=750 RepID=UPI00222E6168|nr:YadA-like family protein [Gallibacterium anatis]UZD16237.1 YadA-like family protein [Gallibacterium anatis]
MTDDPFYRSPGFAVAVGNNLIARQNTVILGHDNETNNTLTTTLGIFAKTNNDRAIAIGYGPKADGLDGLAIGSRAEEKGYLSMAIGTSAKALSQQAVAIGPYATAEKGSSATAIGMESKATGKTSSALGPWAEAHGKWAAAVGVQAHALAENSLAIGQNAKAKALNSAAFGGLAVTDVNAEQSLAVGYNTKVSGKQSLAIGVGNLVSANYAGAIGDPSIVKGDGSYTLGNDNAVGSTSTNVGAFGNNNQIGATATYDDTGKLLSVNDLTDTEAVENSRAVGNKNYINTSNTYVLGSGVGTKDDGTELRTVENSVYLGNDSTVAVGAAVGTANLDKEGVAGATTTAGDTGTVDTAIVGGVTYGGFVGKTAAGAVSVGAAGLERRVMNVAAGEISATSTDAINGSQLYMVAQGTLNQMPVIYTDTSGNKVIKSPDGNFYPANTPLDATGKPLDPAIQPVTNVIASMNDGDDVANTPKILANVAGNLTPTYNKGDMTIGSDGKPTAIAATTPTTSQTGPSATDAAKIYNNAATVGDILNAGWNLQGNGAAKDFVKPYDTVNFADGTGTKVDVTTSEDGKTNTIKVNVDAQGVTNDSQLAVVYTDKDGNQVYPIVDEQGNVTYNRQPDGKGDVVDKANVITSINGPDGTTTPTMLSNVAGNLTPTYNKGDMTIGSDGKPTAIAATAPTTSQTGPSATDAAKIYNNAATVGDILNAGWNLQGNGAAKDFVKPYDTVNFADGTGTKVDVTTSEDGKTNTIKVNVDAQGVTNDSQLAVVYTDKDGNQVYPIVDEQGNVTYNRQPDGKGDVVDKANVITSINGPDGTTTPTMLSNVAGNLTPTYNKGDMTIGSDGKPTAIAATAPTTSQTGPSATDAAKIYNNAATVGDILNAGWNLQGNGAAKDFVKPYDTVNFADGTGTKVDVTTSEDGKTNTIKVNVDAQGVTNDSQLAVVYTDKDGNQVYPIVDEQGNVTYNRQPDGKGDVVDKANVITSINGPDGTTTPTMLSNVAGNLTPTYNKGDMTIGSDGKPTAIAATAPTTSQTGPSATDAAKIYNNAATVGDILNAGWNLQGNGAAKDFVKPYDTVNFVNGNATTAIVETAADGKSSTVKYDVQVDGSTIKVVDGKLTVAADNNTVTGVTAGDNITVTSTTDASGNPTYTVATKKDVTFDSVSINGGPTINADGINMNGDKITNVADGDISPTSKDAVNGSQLYSAVNNINSNIAASKEEVTSNDKSVTVTTTKNASGSNVFDLSVNTDGTTITKNANGVLTVNTTPLTNNTDGSVNTPAAPNAIATASDVANAINNSGFSLSAQGANASLVKPGSVVDMNNTDGNIRISKSTSSNNVTYNLSKDIKVDSISVGDTLVNNDGITISKGNSDGQDVRITKNGLNNGGNRITNVANGEVDSDAATVGQLKSTNQNVYKLEHKVNHENRNLRAGIAGANAAAALPQAYIPGKSMIAAATGTYRGQSALAVGYSSISDNGKVILKLQGNTNTRGNIGGAIGVGYQW